MTKVLIIGAGFAGVKIALKLANKPGVRIQLVSPTSYFEYHAALYRAATGRSPLEVAIPLQDFFEFASNIEVVEDYISAVDQKSLTATGETGSHYKYDKLVLAFGNKTDFYNIPGLEQFSYGVKTINQALHFKQHLHQQLNNSDIEQSYVVVGAGATGVELSAEMVEYLHHVRNLHGVDNDFTVYLVEAKSRVLSNLPESYSIQVEKRLAKIGVELITDVAVAAETKDYIELGTKKVATHTVVWTAGVTNHDLAHNLEGDFKLGKFSRINVDDSLQASEHIYVAGDAANTKYSGMAQTAIHHGDYIAKHILSTVKNKPFKPYEPRKPIYAVPVGPRWSAVLWGRVEVFGYLGWILRRLADLRLYINFLPLTKALTTWRYGFKKQEVCDICKAT